MNSASKGFTIIELLMVLAVIGILAAIAYPSYQNYLVKTKRAEMMTEMQNIGSQLESRKLANGRRGWEVQTSDLTGSFPRSGTANYTVAINLDANNDNTKGDWLITATPVAGIMSDDGALTYNSQGVKCRASACGSADEWKN